MGGMLSLRLTLDNPDLFSGIVLVGPLIHFGSSEMLASFPTGSVFPSLNRAFQARIDPDTFDQNLPHRGVVRNFN